jgi:hypothetical protein
VTRIGLARDFLKSLIIELAKFFGIVFGIIAAIVCVAVATIAFVLIWYGQYDLDDPDDKQLQTLFGTPKPTRERQRLIDFSAINQGDWAVLCFFGGYTEPEEKLRRYVEGKGLELEVPATIPDPYHRLMFQVEEHEMSLAYVTKDGEAKIVHFPGYSFQHGSKCITRNEPKMKFPIYLPG